MRTTTPWLPRSSGRWGKGLGDAFTPAVKAAWVEAYTLLATVMQRAAAGEPSLPPTVPVRGIRAEALAA
jgi:hypothetical protein